MRPQCLACIWAACVCPCCVWLYSRQLQQLNIHYSKSTGWPYAETALSCTAQNYKIVRHLCQQPESKKRRKSSCQGCWQAELPEQPFYNSNCVWAVVADSFSDLMLIQFRGLCTCLF